MPLHNGLLEIITICSLVKTLYELDSFYRQISNFIIVYNLIERQSQFFLTYGTKSYIINIIEKRV